MGFSGMKGQVYYVDDNCPSSDCTGWDAPTETSPTCLPDEVTQFTVEDGGFIDEYGHDKSFGWQDAVAGIRRYVITLECNWRPKGVSADEVLHFGKVLYLQLHRLGSGLEACVTPDAGYAVVQRVTPRVDQRQGRVVGFTATLVSKGPWTGPQAGATAWGGFECACLSGS